MTQLVTLVLDDLHEADEPSLHRGKLARRHLVDRLDRPGERSCSLRRSAVGALVAGAAVFLPVSFPILSIDGLDRYVGALTFGAFKNVYELTGDMHGMLGWRERVETTARAWKSLAPEERKRAVIFAPWYGPAAAVDYFGKAHGLPGAVSGHMTYHLWGLPEGPIDTVLVISQRSRLKRLRKHFAEVTVAARTQLENVNPWERNFSVLLCRKPKKGLPQALAQPASLVIGRSWPPTFPAVSDTALLPETHSLRDCSPPPD